MNYQIEKNVEFRAELTHIFRQALALRNARKHRIEISHRRPISGLQRIESRVNPRWKSAMMGLARMLPRL